MRRSLLLAAAPLILLSACAGAGSGPPSAALRGRIESPSVSPYGMFLAGQAALNDGKSGEAARYFEQAKATEPDVMVTEKAFIAALLAGDVDKAAQLAPTGEDASEATKRLGK